MLWTQFGLHASWVAGSLTGALAKRLGQPAVVGEIVAGVLLGPTLFGASQGRKCGLHGESHVLERGKPREQRVVLKHERAVPSDFAERSARRSHVAA